MSAVLDSLLRVDVSRVSAHVLEGLKAKTMTLSASNGNVYWAADSGKTGIVAQLPLVPVSAQELESAEQLLQIGRAVQGAQAAAVTATAVSTAVVVGAIVVATAYLARKIDTVERAVKGVALTVDQQDRREYLDRMSDYTGAIQAASELLQSRAPQGEMASQAELRLDDLARSRHQLLVFIRGLPQLVESPEQTTQAQYELALQFMLGMLDLIPAALAVERELCLAANKPALARSRINDAGPQFRDVLESFRQWCEGQYRRLALGQGGFADVLLAQRPALNRLFNVATHDLLLGGFDAVLATEITNAAVQIVESPPSTTEPDRVIP